MLYSVAPESAPAVSSACVGVGAACRYHLMHYPSTTTLMFRLRAVRLRAVRFLLLALRPLSAFIDTY